jgi:PadR family transcriptional regulator
MNNRNIYPGLIRLHVLYHAARGPLFGLEMIRELRRHGYELSAGTIYPLLHNMEKAGYLKSKRKLTNGRFRRFYQATPLGRRTVKQARARVRELFGELFEEGKAGQRPPKDF